MANILRPLQVESPYQALQGAASAFGAYEQLQGIRAKRAQMEGEAQRKSLIQRLSGPALSGDTEALSMLQNVAPKELLELQQLQSKLLSTQAEAEQKRIDADRAAQSFDRNSILQGVQVARGIVKQLEANPGDQDLWDQIRARATFDGLVEEGTLGEKFPTPEELQDFNRQLDLTENLAQDHVAVNELKGASRAIAAAEGFGTPGYRRKMQAYTDGLIAKNYPNREPLSTLPPGVSLLQEGAYVTQRQRTEFRDTAMRIAPILSSINEMNTFMGKYGFQLPVTVADAMGKLLSTALGMRLKEGFKMGALDIGVERQLSKLVPKDITAWRQGKAKGQLDTLFANVARQLHKEARVNNLKVDVDQFLGEGLDDHGARRPELVDYLLNMDLRQRAELVKTMQREHKMAPRQTMEFMKALEKLVATRGGRGRLKVGAGNNQLPMPQPSPIPRHQQEIEQQIRDAQPQGAPGGASLIPTPAQPGEATQTPGSEVQQEEVRVTQTQTVAPRTLGYNESLRFLQDDMKNIPKTKQGIADWAARKMNENYDADAVMDSLREHAGGTFTKKQKQRYMKAIRLLRKERTEQRKRRREAAESGQQEPQEPAQAPQEPNQGQGPEQGSIAPQGQAQPVVMRPGDPTPELVNPVMRPGDPQPQLVNPVMRPGDPTPQLVQAVQPSQAPLDYMRQVDEQQRRRGEQPDVRPEYRARVQIRLDEARRQAAAQQKAQREPQETRQERRARLRKERIEARRQRALQVGRRRAMSVTRGMFPLLSDEEKRRVIQQRRMYQEYMQTLDSIMPEAPRPGVR